MWQDSNSLNNNAISKKSQLQRGLGLPDKPTADYYQGDSGLFGSSNTAFSNESFYNSSFSASLPEVAQQQTEFATNSIYNPKIFLQQEQLAPEPQQDLPVHHSTSRANSAVPSHFTTSKDGYNRLLNEIDDFVHVVSSSALIKFTTPSVLAFLEYSQEEVIGRLVFC